jgi:hypothetical protein
MICPSFFLGDFLWLYFDTVLVCFLGLWQNTWENQLKGKKTSLTHSFRGFSPWSLLHCFRSVVRQNSMAASTCQNRATYLMVANKWGRGEWAKYTLQGHIPNDLLLPARHRLLNFPPPPSNPLSCESINELSTYEIGTPMIHSPPEGPSSGHCWIEHWAIKTWAFGGYLRSKP